MNNQWNSNVVTPIEEGSGTKVLDNQSNVQPTIEAGENIVIENGTISATGDLEQVQSDWNQTDTTAVDYIKNKPEIPSVDQTFDATSEDAQSGTAVAEAISDVRQVPTTQSSDSGKILGVTDAAGTVGWVEDQNTEYTFSTGLTNSNNTVSVDTSVIATKSDLEGYQPVIENLNTIESGAAAGATAVQPEDLATVATSGSYNDLSNKPTIPTVDQSYSASSTNAQSGVAVASAISGKQDTISDLSTIRSGAEAGATAVQPSQLATVATSGSYTDLSNKPSIPDAQVNSDWDAVSGVSQILNKPTLATVATSGSYNDLTDKPSIPAAQVNADWNSSSGVSEILNKPTLATVATSGSYDDLTNKPSIPAAQVNSDWDAVSGAAQILNKPNLATVATSGSYADLSNKPTIPTVDQVYSASSANAQSGVAVASAISGKQDTISDLETIRSGAALGATAVQPSALATVATSGSYNDLSNKPTIPAAQVNSDWDAVSGVAQILNKPTLATVATSGSYADLSNKPTIPTVDQSYSASSTNAQSGTAVANAISAVKQVPSSTSADEDKVLTVDSNGDAVWANAPTELPASLGTAGQVLTVNSGATGIEWATPSGGGASATILTTSNTYAEVAAAVTASNNVYICLDHVGDQYSNFMEPVYLPYIGTKYSNTSRDDAEYLFGGVVGGYNSTPPKLITISMSYYIGWVLVTETPVPNYTAGSGITRTIDTYGNRVFSVNTTVIQAKLTDVTDIQLVQDLPASPTSGVLYLIPETT